MNVCMCRTLLEKATASGSSILRVVVGPEGVNVSFASQTGQQTATLAHPIGQKNWTHLAVQVRQPLGGKMSILFSIYFNYLIDLRYKDYVWCGITIGSVSCLCTPVSLSVPEM